MFSKIASLFRKDASTFTNLEFFHTTLPYMQGTSWDDDSSDYDTSSDDDPTDEDDERSLKRLPDCGITSMSLAMQDDQGIEYGWLDQLSSIIEKSPELRFLELRDWTATNDPAMEQYFFDDPGTWSPTHLSLLDCGPVTEDMIDVSRKFRDLQSLRITSGLAPNSKRDGMDDPIRIDSAVFSIAAVQKTLVELEFDPGPCEHWDRGSLDYADEFYQSTAFLYFRRLRRLQAPLEMFSQATGKMFRDDFSHNFYTNFPQSLEKLTLVVTCREPFHRALEGSHFLSSDQVVLEERIVNISKLDCETETYEKAHELFGELSRLTVQKDRRLPVLRELHLLRDPCQWLDCEHVKQDTRMLEEAGIACTCMIDRFKVLLNMALGDGSRRASKGSHRHSLRRSTKSGNELWTIQEHLSRTIHRTDLGLHFTSS